MEYHLPRMKFEYIVTVPVFLVFISVSWGVAAHDPVFSPGPHVLFKGGIEFAVETHISKAGYEEKTELGLEAGYGITGDWSTGLAVPYLDVKEGSDKSSGRGDIEFFTKYRFWRNDTLGRQESAAALLKIKSETGDDEANPPLGTGARNILVGLTYGVESLKWYRWASIRHRSNETNYAGLRHGNALRIDIVGGLRPAPPKYLVPDTVWLLELNGEYSQHAELNGAELKNTGGRTWFLSPGIFWTLRNFAIKAGAQIPIASDMHGTQENPDYRAKLILEWHL